MSLPTLWADVGFTPNPAQEQAIGHIAGPLYLPAGPGSGKTHVLLWRTVNLIVFHGVKPDEIFLSTFTEKAALQLKEGLRGLLAIASRHTERRRQGIAERYDFKFRRRDGSALWSIVSTNPFFDEIGSYSGTLSLITDITERMQADAALSDAYVRLAQLNQDVLRSRNLLRTLFDAIDDGLLLLDRDDHVLASNQALAASLGYTAEKLVGQRWAALYEIEAVFPAAWVLDGLLDGRPRQRRERVVGPDGRMRILDIRTLPLVGPEHAVDLLVVHTVDVTTQLQIEARMIAQERFAASGRLAATVAHEVNTPLQAIESSLHLASRVSESQRLEYLNLAREELHRVSHILRQLLDLFRPATGARAPLDVNTLIGRVLLLTSSTLAKQSIDVDRDLAPDLPPLWGRADELIQVLLNLVVNATHAMPGGGTLRVGTRVIDQPPTDRLAETVATGGQMLEITIADTGVGMTSETQQRIFDPFFTTKPDGSGLGLAICQQIVALYGGRITVRSEIGRGSIFSIGLPLS